MWFHGGISATRPWVPLQYHLGEEEGRGEYHVKVYLCYLGSLLTRLLYPLGTSLKWNKRIHDLVWLSMENPRLV